MTAWQEVGDRVWVRRYDPFDVNATVIGTGGPTVVVDTRGSLAEGRQLRRDIAALPVPQPDVVINTHDHFDHAFGNAAFTPATIWGHVRCRDGLERRGEVQRQAVLSWLDDPSQRENLASTPLEPPSQTVTARHDLHVGDRTLWLCYLGRGHTDNDLIVEVADAEVVLAGDLVEQSAPPAYDDAWPLSWPHTLRALLRQVGPATVVVPGHGSAVDRGFVAAQAAEVARLADLLREHLDQGAPIDRLLAHSPFPQPTTRTALARAAAERRVSI